MAQEGQSNQGDQDVPAYRAHIQDPKVRKKPKNKWNKDEKMWMKNPANGVFEWIMYIVEPQYNDQVRRYYYKVRDKSGIPYESLVAERDLEQA